MKKKSPITAVQQRDTILALLLILLIAFYFLHSIWLIHAMAVVLVTGMVVPALYTPAARFWFGFSHLLGSVMSRVIMGVLFFALVTPIGLFRRMLGKDAMRLKQWRKDDSTAFVVREHRYTPEDFKHPY